MIGYLQGTIHKKLAKNIILNTGSVGYVVNVAGPLLEKCREGKILELFIFTKVREDDISLYGFPTVEELEFFKTVLNVNGIGPKIALEMLSQDMDKTKTAILSNDILFLNKIPGIGKKTAERIIVELKNKLDWVDSMRLHGSTQEKETNEEAIEALAGLGYQRFEITRILKNLPAEITTTEDIVTYFLRNN
jgi:Holliday junction DNA helicase RuvA